MDYSLINDFLRQINEDEKKDLEDEKGDSYSDQEKNAVFDALNQMNEANEQNTSQTKNFDEMLTSILKDLEFAEVSLQSTSHLIDSPDINSCDGVETNDQSSDFDSISYETKDTVETPNDEKENYGDIQTCSEQESNLPLVAEDNNLEPTKLKEPPKSEEESELVEISITDNNSEVHEKNLKDPSSTESQTDQTSNQSKVKTEPKVGFPNANPYINFVQDFKAKYKGQEVTNTTLIALAAAKWRKMGKEEKQIYKSISKSHSKNKQVDKLKKYIKSLKISEDTLFHPSNF